MTVRARRHVLEVEIVLIVKFDNRIIDQVLVEEKVAKLKPRHRVRQMLGRMIKHLTRRSRK